MPGGGGGARAVSGRGSHSRLPLLPFAGGQGLSHQGTTSGTHGLLGLLHGKVYCCLQDCLTSQNQKLPGRKPCIFHDLFSPSSLCKIPCRGLARKGMLCDMFAFLLGTRRKPAIYCRVNSLQSRSESNPFCPIARTRSRTRTKRDPLLPEAAAPA